MTSPYSRAIAVALREHYLYLCRGSKPWTQINLMAHNLCFGVGCFNFGVSIEPPFTLAPSSYVGKIENILGSVATIDDINIEYDEELSSAELVVLEKPPSINKGPGYFPTLEFLKIEFDIFIPRRVQSEIAPWKSIDFYTGTEKFRVRIVNTYYFPVTFVECIEPTSECSPSDAVVIVRKFLQREIEKLKPSDINFEFLGPSPFHVNCYVEPSPSDVIDTLQRSFVSRYIPKDGYDKITFFYDGTKFPHVSGLMDKLFDEISGELGFFYQVVQSNVTRMYEWIEIEDDLRRLASLRMKKGVWGALNRLVNLGRRIDDGIIRLTEFEAESVMHKSELVNEYRDLFSRAGLHLTRVIPTKTWLSIVEGVPI